ncbi:MAG TPA: DUF4166 domain-containing protein [Dongiaceae bacterium]|nr:DUF4166 domain-containing protein [Dongiaceae bacterium]
MTLTPQPLFRRTMGRLFHLLPAPVRQQHGVLDVQLSTGRCDIERGTAWNARLIAWLFGFPPAGRDLPTTVTVISEGRREIWYRDFGGRGIFTVLEAAAHAGKPVIVERFGWGVAFDLAICEVEGGLRLSVIGMRACGLKLPRWLWPKLDATERAERQRFLFDIDIRLGWGDALIRYRGWVTPPATA